MAASTAAISPLSRSAWDAAIPPWGGSVDIFSLRPVRDHGRACIGAAEGGRAIQFKLRAEGRIPRASCSRRSSLPMLRRILHRPALMSQ